MATYKGKFTKLKNPSKYVGDASKIVYRSLWERNVMRWCDQSDTVAEWASEEIAIPYIHPVTLKRARYFPDFYIKMTDSRIIVVEVKPAKETKPPIPPKKGSSKRYIQEQSTYVINAEKWANAELACRKNNIGFEVWTEDTLKKMGILNWEADKTVLAAERRSMSKSKHSLKPIGRTKPKVGPPKRRS